MPRHPEETLSFHLLYDSTILAVRDYRCRACRGGPAAEELTARNDVVLMRHGVFRKHIGRRSVTADVNQAVFFSKDAIYRVSHPAECGDRGTVLTLAPPALNDIVREFDPAVDDRPDRPFPFLTGPCEAGVFWRHRELVRGLERADAAAPDPLWVETAAMRLLAEVVGGAFAHRGPVRSRRRARADADHAERIEAAKQYLASRQTERVTLDAVARAVHASPFHLARRFQQHTGVPIHRYLTRLRLRAALERLADGADDLAALALELGFSSHSHFTDAFRREFGHTPSAVRRGGPRRREMRKNLKV